MPDTQHAPSGPGQHTHKIAWAIVIVIIVLFIILIAVAASIRANHDPNAEVTPPATTSQQVAPAESASPVGDGTATPGGEGTSDVTAPAAPAAPAPESGDVAAPEPAAPAQSDTHQ